MIRFFSISSFVALTLLASGCGAKPVPVNGVVLLDGKPVEDATVTFVTADGKMSANGFTDASGNFSLSVADQPGAFPGEYKVVVVKTPKGQVVTNTDPSSSEYMKHMKKEAAEQSKGNAPGDMMKMKMMGKAGAPSAPPGGGGPGGASAVKSELPATYASATTTPLTSKVPPDSQPVKIELKSK